MGWHIERGHVTQMRRSCDSYEGKDSLAPYLSHMYIIERRHVTHMKESCHTDEEVL